jgi:4-hydroxy-tetrahydrodipicolinate synthase
MMRARERFGPVITAMATPFGDDGDLDLAAAARLARFLEANGSTSLVVTGSTGESGTLSDAERKALWACAAEAVAIPVIAGATTNDTAHSIRLVRDAEAVGAAGILVVTPYYNRPPQAGIMAHVRAIAEATSLPLVLYDVPARTGRRMELDTIVTLAVELEQVVALKDASGDLGRAARLVPALRGHAELLAGDDGLLVPFLALGAAGVVSVASHWAGRAIGALIERFDRGDQAGAQALGELLLPSFGFLSSDAYPNPIPTKAMLAAVGLCAPRCRLPLVDAKEN